MADLGLEVDIRIGMDASAAMAMAKRRGVGKAKHMHCQYLWIQLKIAEGTIVLHKVETKDNRADLLTKHANGPKINKLMEMMGLVCPDEGQVCDIGLPRPKSLSRLREARKIHGTERKTLNAAR